MLSDFNFFLLENNLFTNYYIYYSTIFISSLLIFNKIMSISEIRRHSVVSAALHFHTIDKYMILELKWV